MKALVAVACFGLCVLGGFVIDENIRDRDYAGAVLNTVLATLLGIACLVFIACDFLPEEKPK